MNELGTRKAIPSTIAVFGAAGHIGNPLARQLRYRSPETKLRLISSSAEKCAQLAEAFPEAQCMVADLFDAASLVPALDGVEGVFVVTPSPFDETTAMGNFIRVMKDVANPVHIVRIVGYEPETLLRRVPEALRRMGGTAQQHHIAKDMLDESDLPVTYLNIGASYMDNFHLMAHTIKTQQRVVWPERLISYLDARDVGEIGANLLLSRDERHIYQFHTLNNGQDLLETAEVVEIVSDILKIRLGYESSRQAFINVYGPPLAMRSGKMGVAEQILDFIDYERGNASFLMLSDISERLLGRKPTTVRAWLTEHRANFLA